MKLIQKIPLCLHDQNDCQMWSSNNNGEFLVKSAYWMCRNTSPPSNQDATRGLIWKSKIHDRLKMYLWRVAVDYLPTKTTLARFTNNRDIICPLCNANEETCLHLFVYCLCAQSVWFNCQWGLKLENLGINSLSQLIGAFLNPPWKLILMVTRGMIYSYLELLFVIPFGKPEI